MAVTPTDAAELRAMMAQQHGIARSQFAYAWWLHEQGFEGRARQVYREGSQACARGLAAELALEALEGR